MNAKKLTESYSHGRASSYLIKTLSTTTSTPTVPSCIPVGIGTINYNEIGPNESPPILSYRINGGDIITLNMGGHAGSPPSLEDMNTFEGVTRGIEGSMVIYPPLYALHKFNLPDAHWGSGFGLPVYFGGVSSDGVVKLLGHDINLENTVLELYSFDNDDFDYYRIRKAQSHQHRIDILPVEGTASIYDQILDLEFYNNQRIKNPALTHGAPIITTSCGGFILESFVPSKLSDIEKGYIEFEVEGINDMYDYDALESSIVKINGVDYDFLNIVDSDDGVVVNDGVLTLESRDGSYLMSVCCTDSRLPVNVEINNPDLKFIIRDVNGPYDNARVTNDSLLEACLTPPAIAPFYASSETGLHIPSGGGPSANIELYGEVKLNDKPCGRVKFIDGYGGLITKIDGQDFQFYYGDDDNFAIKMGLDDDDSNNDNTNAYYKLEIKFDSNPMYLKATNVWYHTRSWNVPFGNRNPTASLNVNTNTFKVFMKYDEVRFT